MEAAGKNISSPDHGLQVTNIEIDGLDIHGNNADNVCTKGIRNRSSDEEVDIQKRTKMQKIGEASDLGLGQDMVEDTGNRGRKVVLIRFLDLKKRCTDPRKLGGIINKSVFHKYVTDFSIRNLGNGNGCRLEVNDRNGRIGPVEKVTVIDGIKVRCWYPSEPATQFGRIGPISNDFSIEDLMDSVHIMGQDSIGKTKITSIKRLKDRNGKPSEQVVFGISGSLPQMVAIDNVTYHVSKYIRPPLRCYNCHLFGHGTLTCKNNKRRCIRCGLFHEDLASCTKPFYCVFCKGDHKYSSRDCPVNIKAKKIENDKNSNVITLELAKERFRDLNRKARESVVHRPRTSSPTDRSRPMRPNQIPISIELENLEGPKTDASFTDEESFVGLESGPRKSRNVWQHKKSKVYASSPKKHRPTGSGARPKESFPSLPRRDPMSHPLSTRFYEHRPEYSIDDMSQEQMTDGHNESSLEILLQAAADLYEIYKNEKSFFENFPAYFKIVGDVVRKLRGHSL